MVDSLWDGIKRVYSSEKVTYNISNGAITTERYWQPEYKPNEDLRELVIDAIKKVKVSDVPVYVFLSGGIDSSVVTSQGFGNAIHMDGNERQYAEQVATRFGTKLHIVSPKHFDAVECMTDYVQKCGEPSMSALIPYIVSREAAKLCKVAVSANGADELMFGYDRTQQDITTNQYYHIFRQYNYFPEEDFMGIDERLSLGRWLELQTYVQHDLNKTLDFASMAHGLEVRSPFLNHKLVEAALSQPKEKIGRKSLLKQMLKEYGFNDQFLNRPKMGFTLYQQPTNYDVTGAFNWCIKNGWLKAGNYSPRDLQYLKATAFSFKIWWETFKNKIQ
jgi:asparagine synthase (glutamine-hydrolysing)